MSTLSFKKTYSCTDDCKQSGCPKHEAILTYQTTSGAYTFSSGRHAWETYTFDEASLSALIEMLAELQDQRVDVVLPPSVVDAALIKRLKERVAELESEVEGLHEANAGADL